MNTQLNSTDLSEHDYNNLILSHEAEIRNLKGLRHKVIKAGVTQESLAAEKELHKHMMKAKYQTNNGLTVYGLRKAGHTVNVLHLRYAAIESVPVVVPVPSWMRGVFDFLPRGGATHIRITRPDKEWFMVSSVCHEDDSFDYRLGVTTALNQLSIDEAKDLMAFTAIDKQ